MNEYILVEQGIIKWHFADKVEDGGDLGAMGPPDQAKKRKRPSMHLKTCSIQKVI